MNKKQMKQAPCKDCTKRELGCHGKCELYKEFQVETQEFKRNIKKQKRESNEHIAYLKDVKEKHRRCKR